MIYFLIFILSYCITFFIKNYAIKKNFIDIPNQRSSHIVPIPHGGGIGICITWFLGLILFFVLDKVPTPLFISLCFGFLISVISFLDDLFEITPIIRLLCQAFVAILGIYFLDGLKQIDFGFFILTNHFILNIFAFFTIIWFINLYNFLDGIDGYAGSEAIFLSISAFFLFGGDYFLILACSVFGFLILNWHKAKIFMGDVGSTLLGYNVAIFALYFQNMNYPIFIWFILFGLFFFDATLTLFRRFKNKEKLYIAHKKHAYQRLHQSGYSHDKVVFLGMGINVVLFMFAYFALFAKTFSFLIFIFAMFFLYFIVKIVDKKREFSK